MIWPFTNCADAVLGCAENRLKYLHLLPHLCWGQLCKDISFKDLRSQVKIVFRPAWEQMPMCVVYLYIVLGKKRTTVLSDVTPRRPLESDYLFLKFNYRVKQLSAFLRLQFGWSLDMSFWNNEQVMGD